MWSRRIWEAVAVRSMENGKAPPISEGANEAREKYASTTLESVVKQIKKRESRG